MICMCCGRSAELVHVHGHYQCPVCKTNSMPCCDGDNCETNVLLKNNEDLSTQTSNIKSINSNGCTGSNYH